MAANPKNDSKISGDNWTRENLIRAGELYHAKYGEVPSQIHFYPAMAKKSNNPKRDEFISRFINDGVWPSSSTIIKHFKSFGEFQKACGFEPTSSRGSGAASKKLEGLRALEKELFAS